MESYREILTQALENRSQRRPGYSQNALARDLGLRPSQLSEVLRGKKGLSRTSAERVAQVLGLDPHLRTRFCDMVESEHGRSRKKRERAQARLEVEIELHGRYRVVSQVFESGKQPVCNNGSTLLFEFHRGGFRFVATGSDGADVHVEGEYERLGATLLLFGQRHGGAPLDHPFDPLPRRHCIDGVQHERGLILSTPGALLPGRFRSQEDLRTTLQPDD